MLLAMLMTVLIPSKSKLQRVGIFSTYHATSPTNI